MKKVIKLGIISTLVVATIATGGVAQAGGGTSSTLIDGVRNVPCDGVVYPVATWKTAYTVDAESPVKLSKGVAHKLNVTGSRAIANTVTVTDQKTVTLKWVLEFVSRSIPNTDIAVQSVKTFTDTTTDTFTSSDEISLTPKVPGLNATPKFYKLQAFGSTYKCEPGEKPKRHGPIDAVYLDVVAARGWEITDSYGEPAIPGKDY